MKVMRLTGLAFACVLLCFAASAPAHAIEGVGGGPTSAGVNDYSPQGQQCRGGPFPESTCNEDRVKQSLVGIVPNYVTAFQLMAEQLAAGLTQQAQMIGVLFDADEMVDAQRDLQILKAGAHKNYHPSDQMCRFGSFMRSVASSEARSDMNRAAINKALVDRYTAKAGMAAAAGGGYAGDIAARLDVFKTIYCDPNDNNQALAGFCEAPSNPSDEQRARFNRDIDYARSILMPLTLDVDFANADDLTPQEQDILVLARSLYWPIAANLSDPAKLEETYSHYINSRSNMAKHIIAHNSFITQVAMKASSDNGLGVQSGPAYMKALMREFGMEDGEIHQFMGKKPSYYAQMAVLTKKIYQHPDFYTNLYDKPVNIARINASLEAIQLMQGRDFYESQLRQEMLVSQMIDARLYTASKAASARASTR